MSMIRVDKLIRKRVDLRDTAAVRCQLCCQTLLAHNANIQYFAPQQLFDRSKYKWKLSLTVMMIIFT